jgi:transposase
MLTRLWVIEGAGTYGAILAGTVASHNYPVAEVSRMDAKKRRGVGKADALDAHQIAAATLPLLVEKLRRPRLNDGIRQAVRILTTARGAMSADRTRPVNALNALARNNNLGVDARRPPSASHTSNISRGGGPRGRTVTTRRPDRGHSSGETYPRTGRAVIGRYPLRPSRHVR